MTDNNTDQAQVAASEKAVRETVRIQQDEAARAADDATMNNLGGLNNAEARSFIRRKFGFDAGY